MNKVDFQYDEIKDFSEGLAAFKKNGKWGLIDKNGKIIIDCKYDFIGIYKDGMARVKLNDKWGFIDETGKIVIDCKYNDAHDFNDGVALVKEGILDKYIYIDKKGKTAVDISLSDIGFDFSGGLLGDVVNGVVSNINKNIVMLENAASFSEGLAYVTVNEKKGYIDKQGTMVIDLTERVDSIHNSVDRIEKSIETIGDIESAKSLTEGESPFSYSTKDLTEDFIKMGINTIANMTDTISSLYLYLMQINNYGDAGVGYSFKNGYAAVKHNGKWGYIDKNGETIIDYQYDSVKSFVEINNDKIKMQ